MKHVPRPALAVSAAFLLAMTAACSSTSSSSDSTASAAAPSSSDATVASSSAPAESESAPTEIPNYRISFANVSEAGGLAKVIGDGVRSAAVTAGQTLKSYNNIPDLTKMDPAQTLQNLKLMIQENPDIIIEYNGIQNIGESLGKQIEESGIPCIAVNNSIPGCHFFNLSNRQIGIDAGNLVAPMIEERGWTAEDTVILLLQASVAGTDINDSVRYFYTTLAEQIPGLAPAKPEDITAQTTKIGETGLQVDGGASLQTSYNVVKNALQSIPEDKNLVLFGINDDSVMGGFRAITEAGRNGNTIVGGLGSSAEAREELRNNPSWMFEGEVFPAYWGEYLMAMAVAILNGETPPDLTVTPQTVMTKETIDDYFDPVTDSPRALPPLPPENQYLVNTGVLQKFGNVQGLS